MNRTDSRNLHDAFCQTAIKAGLRPVTKTIPFPNNDDLPRYLKALDQFEEKSRTTTITVRSYVPHQQTYSSN